MKIALFIISLLGGIISANGQQVLTVQTGGGLYMQQHATVSFGGLVFRPSSNYTLTGANSLVRGSELTHPATGQHIERVYTFSQAIPAFTGTMYFYYEDSELNGLTESELTFNSFLSNWGTNPTMTVDAANNYVAFSVSNFQYMEGTLASIHAALPLQWLAIAAALKVNVVQVNWETANEHNVAGFIVEKQVNGSWQLISPLLPAANTAGPNRYSFNDEKLSSGTSYYRVLQKDFDGKNSYSQTVTVKNAQYTALTIYPNPITDVVKIRTNSSNVLIKTVTVLNASGISVASVSAGNNASYDLAVQQLPAGTYVLQVLLSNGSTEYKKIIK